ncbi:hypothetical protein CEXT_99391 [Caerostris extrusa]|uniref:Uncharacterized protein n=1 Tax=Caerostris extrusa TaxID=172846 RepID=A0AAV4XIJ2_CAEEX|nr:hypothetical protein CEXT_99391 [Caerostris extrusa]
MQRGGREERKKAMPTEATKSVGKRWEAPCGFRPSGVPLPPPPSSAESPHAASTGVSFPAVRLSDPLSSQHPPPQSLLLPHHHLLTTPAK